MIFKEVSEDEFAEMSFIKQTIYYFFHPLHKNNYLNLLGEGILELSYTEFSKKIIQHYKEEEWITKPLILIELPMSNFFLWFGKTKIKSFQKKYPEELL